MLLKIITNWHIYIYIYTSSSSSSSMGRISPLKYQILFFILEEKMVPPILYYILYPYIYCPRHVIFFPSFKSSKSQNFNLFPDSAIVECICIYSGCCFLSGIWVVFWVISFLVFGGVGHEP